MCKMEVNVQGVLQGIYSANQEGLAELVWAGIVADSRFEKGRIPTLHIGHCITSAVNKVRGTNPVVHAIQAANKRLDSASQAACQLQGLCLQTADQVAKDVDKACAKLEAMRMEPGSKEEMRILREVLGPEALAVSLNFIKPVFGFPSLLANSLSWVFHVTYSLLNDSRALTSGPIYQIMD